MEVGFARFWIPEALAGAVWPWRAAPDGTARSACIYGELLTAEDVAALATPTLTRLSMARSPLGASAAEALAACTSLAHLRVHLCDMGDGGAVALASACAGLRTLDISWNGLVGAQGVAAIAARCAALTHLDVSWNAIGNAGLDALARGCASLCTLECRGNAIDDAGVIALCASGRARNLTALNVSDNHDLRAAGAAALATAPALRALDCSTTCIGDAGATALARAPCLTSLRCGYACIGPDGAAALATAPHLVALELCGNAVRADGATSLAAAAPARLTYLGLSGNRIKSAGAAALAGVATLTALDAAKNDVDSEGAAALAGARSLLALSLQFNAVGARGVEALCAARALTTLDLRHNPVGYGTALLRALEAPASTNFALRHVEFDGGHVKRRYCSVPRELIRGRALLLAHRAHASARIAYIARVPLWTLICIVALNGV